VLALNVNASQLWIAYVAAISYGTGFGWTFICMNTANAHFFGPQAFPKLNGMAMLLTALLCAPAGAIGGRLFDLYGNYRLAFQINMLIAAAGIIALIFATMPVPPEKKAVAVQEAEIAEAQ
jgi:MFS family permease